MTTVQQARGLTVRQPARGWWQSAMAQVAMIGRAAVVGLRRHVAAGATAVPEYPAVPVNPAGAVGAFPDALREDSNLEMDWLWWATRVTAVPEQRYCLLRALWINPRSDLARHELAKLSGTSAA
jgi:hypothetical protein